MTIRGLVGALLALALAPGARAQEAGLSQATQTCLDAFAAGQELRRTGRLRASRDKLAECARSDCPEAVAEKCVRWIGEVGEAIPSVVVVARDARNRDLVDVRVFVDGELRADRLDGRAIEIDPGKHRFRIERAGVRAVERELLVAERHKARRLEVVLAPPPPVPRPKPPAPSPTTPEEQTISPVAWIGFGLGAAAFIAGGVTAGLAAAQIDELEQRCTQAFDRTVHCLDPRDLAAYDHGRALADAATASFIVGGIALGVGVVALVVSLADAPPELNAGPAGIGVAF